MLEESGGITGGMPPERAPARALRRGIAGRFWKSLARSKFHGGFRNKRLAVAVAGARGLLQSAFDLGGARQTIPVRDFAAKLRITAALLCSAGRL
jgi:hypothetical protein